jgi:hypothetical protein
MIHQGYIKTFCLESKILCLISVFVNRFAILSLSLSLDAQIAYLVNFDEEALYSTNFTYLLCKVPYLLQVHPPMWKGNSGFMLQMDCKCDYSASGCNIYGGQCEEGFSSQYL